jgi:hypothetical protein
MRSSDAESIDESSPVGKIIECIHKLNKHSHCHRNQPTKCYSYYMYTDTSQSAMYASFEGFEACRSFSAIPSMARS